MNTSKAAQKCCFANAENKWVETELIAGSLQKKKTILQTSKTEHIQSNVCIL